MKSIEEQYLDLLKKVLEEGVEYPDRTGTGCIGIFGANLKHDMSLGFPLLTSKKMWFKGIWHELKWILRGDDNIDYLKEQGAAQIWSPWAREDGWVGRTYGPSWRNFGGQNIDQLQNAIDGIKKDPHSRRHLVLAWDPVAVVNKQVQLPSCHYAFQFHVQEDKLNLAFTMRSSDLFIGTSWNISFYGLLLHMVAHITGYIPGQLYFSTTDAHIYRNHISQVQEQLSREPKSLPKLNILRPVSDINDFKYEDFELVGYESYASIKAPIAI